MRSGDGPNSRSRTGFASRRRHLVVAVVIHTYLIAAPRAARAADAIESVGVSMESRTRGGTDVAVGDSSLSQVDNPATLTLSPRGKFRFDASGQLLLPENHWTMPSGSSESEIKVLPSASFGLAIPIDDKLTVGLAVHSKSGPMSRHNLRHLMIPFMKRRVYGELKNGSISLNAAYKLTKKLSVGVGVRGEATTVELSTVVGPADVELERGYAWGGGYQLGLHYQARDDLAFGLGYRSPTWFGDLSGGDAEASILGMPPIVLGSGNIDEFRLPQKVSGGVAWDAFDWLKLIGEIRWVNYDYSTLHRATFATDGAVDLRVPFPLGFKDQWVFAAGTEFKLDEHWTLGVGYNFATDPVDDSHVLPVGTLVGHHHITVGPRYRQDNWWVGGGYIVALPSTMRGSGRSRIPLGIDYAYGSVRQTQHSLFLGFGFCW